MLPVPSSQRQHRSLSELQIQQASTSLLAQAADQSISEEPVHVMPGTHFTFRGMDLIPGIVAGANFGMMTMLILMFPARSRRSLWWNLTLSLFALGALSTAMSFTVDIGYARARVSVDPQLISSASESGSSHHALPSVKQVFWQDEASPAASAGDRSRRVTVYLKSLDHTVEHREGFYATLGLALAVLVLGATGVRNSIADGQTARAAGAPPGSGHHFEQPPGAGKSLSRLQAEVRLEVSGPSLMLLIVGILSIIGHGAIVITCLQQTYSQRSAWMSIPGILIGIALFLAGLNLRSLRSRGWVQVGAIAGLVPISVGWFLTAIAGIWTLNTLQKPQIREAFLQAEQHKLET